MIDGAAFKRGIQRIAFLEGEQRRVVAMAAAPAHPAFFREDHRNRFIDHRLRDHRFTGFFNQCAALVTVLLGVGFNLFDHQLFHRRFIVEQDLQFFLLDLEGF